MNFLLIINKTAIKLLIFFTFTVILFIILYLIFIDRNYEFILKKGSLTVQRLDSHYIHKYNLEYILPDDARANEASPIINLFMVVDCLGENKVFIHPITYSDFSGFLGSVKKKEDLLSVKYLTRFPDDTIYGPAIFNGYFGNDTISIRNANLKIDGIYVYYSIRANNETNPKWFKARLNKNSNFKIDFSASTMISLYEIDLLFTAIGWNNEAINYRLL